MSGAERQATVNGTPLDQFLEVVGDIASDDPEGYFTDAWRLYRRNRLTMVAAPPCGGVWIPWIPSREAKHKGQHRN